jgi:hypothetical protein
MPAGPATQISDVIVPEVFTPYVQQLTEEKSRIVQSGVLARNSFLDGLLGQGGLTFNIPSFQDLDADDTNGAERVANDTSHFSMEAAVAGSGTIALDPVPDKIETSQEIAVRLSRNNSWSSMDLTAALAGVDPMEAIAGLVANYWVRRLQRAFVQTWNGVIADNVANDSGDYVNNVSGASFIDGTTNFTTEAFLDTTLTMGDSMDDLTTIFVHSVVFNRMQKNNLIDFIPDARGETTIPTFLGREVIVDDGMPRTGNVYDTWVFGGGTSQLGVSNPKVPTEVERKAGAGNGGGQEVLYNRLEWSIHPVGHAYVQGSPPNGGPSNTDLATATTWNRVFPERKQIKFARLVTREA